MVQYLTMVHDGTLTSLNCGTLPFRWCKNHWFFCSLSEVCWIVLLPLWRTGIWSRNEWVVHCCFKHLGAHLWTTREGPIFDHFPKGDVRWPLFQGEQREPEGSRGIEWIWERQKVDHQDLRRSRITWFDWDHFFSVVHNVNLACSSHIQLFDLQRARILTKCNECPHVSYRNHGAYQTNIAALPVEFGFASPAWLRSATIHVVCDAQVFEAKKSSFCRPHDSHPLLMIDTAKVKVQLSHSCKS